MLRGKKVRMTEERFLQLDAIGFKWSTPVETGSKSTKPRAKKSNETGGDNSTDTSNGSNAEERKCNNPLMDQQEPSKLEKIDHEEPQSINTGQEISPAVPEPERINPSLPNAGDNNAEEKTPDRKLTLEV